MNKVLAIVFLFLIAHTSKAQDTIIFDDARVHPVKIISVDKSSVKYERRGQTKEAKFIDIMQFKRDGIWHFYNENTKSLNSQEDAFFDFATNPLQRPKNFKYSPFSIGITAATDINPNESVYRQNFTAADNWRLRIEPEVHLAKWFSLKIPIIIPLTLDKQESNGQIFTSNHAPQRYDVAGVDYFYRLSNDSWTLPTRYQYGSFNLGGSGSSVREIIGQVGLTSKFYPFLQPKAAFYIGQSFNFGIGNYNQIDYFATFKFLPDYQDEWGGTENHWQLMNERLEVNKAYFYYFRYEATFGFNFNITSSINFALESGFTTSLLPFSQLQRNNVYVIDADDGTQTLTDWFAPNNVRNYDGFVSNAYMLNRILLVYRFGGQRPKVNE